MLRHASALPLLLLAALLLAARPSAARAQDEPVEMDPAPVETAPVDTDPAPVAETGALEFLGADMIRQADGRIVRFYRTNFVSPDVLIPELKRWLSKGGEIEASGPSFSAAPLPNGAPGSLVPAKNVLRIVETEENWPLLEQVIEKIDIPMPQVLVEAKIVELSYDDELRIGISTSVTKPLGDTFFRSYTANFSNPLDTGEVSQLLFRKDEKFLQFEYVLQLAERGARVEVTSRPEILASQGQTARLLIGQREPIVSQQLTSTRVSATTKFEDVGLKLEVTPLFIGREFVRAAIKSEISRVAEFRSTGTGDGEATVINPVISTQTAETVITVPDGETIVIGGLVQEQLQVLKEGFPILKDLPIIGPLFGSTTERETSGEVVFFITMTIKRPWETRTLVPPSEKRRLEQAADDSAELDEPR